MAGTWLKTREHLQVYGPLTARQIGEAVGESADNVHRALARMADHGIVRRVPRTRPIKWVISPTWRPRQVGAVRRSRAYLRRNPRLTPTVREIAEAVRFDHNEIRSALYLMARRGETQTVPGSMPRRWLMTAKGRE